MRMSIYSYTIDCDTFKNDTFKSVIFRYSENDYLDHFDTFKMQTYFFRPDSILSSKHLTMFDQTANHSTSIGSLYLYILLLILGEE